MKRKPGSLGRGICPRSEGDIPAGPMLQLGEVDHFQDAPNSLERINAVVEAVRLWREKLRTWFEVCRMCALSVDEMAAVSGASQKPTGAKELRQDIWHALTVANRGKGGAA